MFLEGSSNGSTKGHLTKGFFAGLGLKCLKLLTVDVDRTSYLAREATQISKMNGKGVRGQCKILSKKKPFFLFIGLRV